MIGALLTTLLWSLGAVASLRLTRRLGSAHANFWRLLVAGVVLAAITLPAGHGLHGPGLPWFLASGFVGFGLGDVALYLALPRLGARLTVLMVQCLAAPVAFIAEGLWLGSTLTPLQLAASTVILLGVGSALAPGSHDVPRGALGSGIGWGLLAAIGQGLGAVLSRQGNLALGAAGAPLEGVLGGLAAAHQRIWPGIAVAAVVLAAASARISRQSTAAAATSAPGALAAAAPAPAPSRRDTAFWLLVTALSGPVVGAGFYQWALATAPGALVLVIVAMTPLAVMPWSWLLDGERPSRRAIAGGCIAAAGAAWLGLAS